MTTRIVLIALMLVFCFLPSAVNSTEDTTAPTVTAFDLSPDTIDTGSAEETLTLTMTLTDDQVGVCIPGDCGNYASSQTQLRLVSPNTEQSVSFTAFTRTSGDDLNGTYSATTTLPQYSQSGVWYADSLLLVDKLGNYVFLTLGDLETAFGNGVSDVTNSAVVEDSTRPVVTAFAITPDSVNTDEADAELTLTMTITDGLAGVCISSDPCGVIGITQLRLIAPNGSQTETISTLTRETGDALNGTYTGTATLPQGSVPGIWSADYLFVVDAVGNNEFIDKAALETAFGAGATDITNTSTNSDSEAPQITAFDISPSEINTSDESQMLTLTMTVTDNAVGACILNDCGNDSSQTQLRLRPLIGTQSISFTSFTRQSGDDLSGVYQSNAIIPRSSKEGVWVVDSLYLVDKLGNNVFLNSEDLQALFPNATGLTIANTAEASSITIERAWTFSSSVASVTFPENTVITKKDGGRFAFYQMVNQAYNIISLPDDGLVGNPVETIRLGIPGLNLEFSQNVTVGLNVGAAYDGRTLAIQSLEEGVASWASETDCTVTNGVCRFTVNHASYFTANAYPKHSIVVGPRAGGGPQVTVWTSGGKRTASFMAYPTTYRGGVTAIMADLNNDGTNEIITAPDSGAVSAINVFTAKGKKISTLYPFTKTFSGGITIAAGDVDGDGRAELVVAPRTTGGPNVRVYDYSARRFMLHRSWLAYSSSYRKGLTLELGDVNGDGKDDILTVTNPGATPHVRVFSDRGKILGQFFAFAKNFLGGVNLSTGDVNGDGKDDIVATPKSGGAPQVRVLRPNGTVVKQFYAYLIKSRIGLTSQVGDYDHDGKAEIIVAPVNGDPLVRVFSRTGQREAQFRAYAKTFRGGVVLSAGDVDGDNRAEIVTGPLANGGPNVKIHNYRGRTKSIVALHPNFRGGLNVSIAR